MVKVLSINRPKSERLKAGTKSIETYNVDHNSSESSRVHTFTVSNDHRRSEPVLQSYDSASRIARGLDKLAKISQFLGLKIKFNDIEEPFASVADVSKMYLEGLKTLTTVLYKKLKRSAGEFLPEAKIKDQRNSFMKGLETLYEKRITKQFNKGPGFKVNPDQMVFLRNPDLDKYTMALERVRTMLVKTLAKGTKYIGMTVKKEGKTVQRKVKIKDLLAKKPLVRRPLDRLLKMVDIIGLILDKVIDQQPIEGILKSKA